MEVVAAFLFKAYDGFSEVLNNIDKEKTLIYIE